MNINDKLIIALAVLAILLTPYVAHTQQQQNGFSISPNGQITQWNNQGGSSEGPDGISSWDNQSGGYGVSGWGYSTWSGPTEPLVPAAPNPLLLPDPLFDPQ